MLILRLVPSIILTLCLVSVPVFATPQSGDEAKEMQREWAEILMSEVVTENSIGMKLVLIPPGEFMMGSPEDEAGQREKERPQHLVEISQPFLMGQFEVTQSQFQRVMGFNPSRFSSTGDGSEHVQELNTTNFPVEQVTWYDAVEFCNKLSELEGVAAFYRLADVERNGDGRITSATVTKNDGASKSYRLPSETEWEFACRAGTSTPFHFGRTSNGHESNIKGTRPYSTDEKGPYLARTSKVGTYADHANGFGLHDMHGNVWEWCWDWYDEGYYGSSPKTDPQGPDSGVERVLRGGAWSNSAWTSRSALRVDLDPSDRGYEIGFRVVRLLD